MALSTITRPASRSTTSHCRADFKSARGTSEARTSSANCAAGHLEPMCLRGPRSLHPFLHFVDRCAGRDPLLNPRAQELAARDLANKLISIASTGASHPIVSNCPGAQGRKAFADRAALSAPPRCQGASSCQIRRFLNHMAQACRAGVWSIGRIGAGRRSGSAWTHPAHCSSISARLVGTAVRQALSLRRGCLRSTAASRCD